MAWGLVSYVANRAVSAFAFPARYLSRKPVDTDGLAPNTATMEKRRLLRLCEREALIAEMTERRRRHLSTCECGRRLRRLTAELAADV